MELYTSLNKVLDLGRRVMRNSMQQGDKEKNLLSDEEAIQELCAKVFNDGSERPSPHYLNQFNNIVTRLADEVAEPDLQAMINYFANSTNVPADTLVFTYKKQHPRHLRFKWTAIGSDVKFSRVEQGALDTMFLTDIQTGISYNALTKREECVENFRALVNDLAHAKVQLIYETIMNMIDKAIAGTGTSPIGRVIPATQISAISGNTMVEFNKIANIIARRTNTRPIFVADRVLIDYFANQILGGGNIQSIIPDSMKDNFYNYQVTNLRTADAIPMVNDFTTLDGVETQFPVNRGYFLGGGSYNKKPFEIALAGGLYQIDAKDDTHGQIELIVRQRIGIDLLAGECIGIMEEDSITGVL